LRAIIFEEYGPPEVLKLAELPKPQIGAEEVLIEVHAAGFNPFDAKVRMGFLKDFFPLTLPHVPGCDVAGVVVERGEAVRSLEVGDRVFGMTLPFRPGSYAEYVAVPAGLLRQIPEGLDFATAAAAPMAGLTAWLGLVELGGVKPGSRVLVQGGAGGVGSFAIQIAKAHGAWVAVTCSTGNCDYVRSLGADQVIDYTREEFTNVLEPVDMVLDILGGEVHQRSYKVIKPGGSMLIVLRADPTEMKSRAENEKRYGVRAREVAFDQRPDLLEVLGRFLAECRIRVPIERRLPLEKAIEAHRACVTGYGRTGHARGKTVIIIRES
jgi:NADPH:quinone reductase-like Zn-dependent oxidoreductase